MKIIDCPWEITNLGVRTCEVSIEANEQIDSNQIVDLMRRYEYVVCKVAACSFAQCQALTSLGMVFNEAQLSINKTFASFDISNRITSSIMRKFSLKECSSIEDLQRIVSKISNVYDTDRIAINPYFGKEIANRRYGNWITEEWIARRSSLFEICRGEKSVGFCLFKVKGQVVDYLLGGMYAEYKDTGIGLCLPLLPYLFKLYLGIDGCDLQTVETKISTNNLPVMQCYMHYTYQVKGVEYVFTKNKK